MYYSGTVKWFNLQRGYGFVIPDAGGRDVFVHISALQKAGLTMLQENQRLHYVLAHSNGKIVADELQLIHEPQQQKQEPQERPSYAAPEQPQKKDAGSLIFA